MGFLKLFSGKNIIFLSVDMSTLAHLTKDFICSLLKPELKNTPDPDLQDISFLY